MADTQSMIKDLISTVEEKVNKPLAQSTGALTSEFYSDPSSTRQRIVSENVGNPLNPLDIDALVGQRRGSIAGQIAGNNALAGSNADILNNYFNLINQQADRASQTAYRNAQLSSSRKSKNYDVLETSEGLRSYDPSTGQLLPGVLAQSPSKPAKYSDEDITTFAEALLRGEIGVTNIPGEIRGQVLSTYEILKNQQKGKGFLGGLQNILGGLGNIIFGGG